MGARTIPRDTSRMGQEGSARLLRKEPGPDGARVLDIAGGICGVAAPVIGIAGAISLARKMDGFSWMHGTFSEITNTDGRAAFGACMSGSAVMMMGLAQRMGSKTSVGWRTPGGAALMALASTALAVCGASKIGSRAHAISSNAYFFTAPAALVATGNKLIRNGNKIRGAAAIGVGVAAASAILMHKKDSLNALNEIAEGTLLGLWCASEGMHMLLRSRPKDRKPKGKAAPAGIVEL